MHPVPVVPFRGLAALLCIVAAAGALAQALPEKAQDAPRAASAVDALSLVVGIMCVLALAVIGVMIRRRAESMAEKEALESATFEMEMLNSLEVPLDDMPIPSASVPKGPGAELELQIAAEAAAPEAETTGPSREAVQPAEPQAPQAATPNAPSILTRLKSANMVKAVEGNVDLPGEPRGGVVVRLRNGKLALLVNSYESERFTAHNLRRFDLIVYATADGKAVAVSKLEDLISEVVASRFPM